MKLKKMCAMLMSGVLAAGMLGVLPSAKTDIGNKIETVMESLDLDTEPMSASAASMRRPCSPDQPMLIVHIDTWNYADPAKIIALIPEDIKPYVVFNISMSINWSSTEHKWLMVQDGYELAKSWLKTCADEGVWCMVQPASGGQCHLPDYDKSGNIVDFPNKSYFVQKADADYENTIYAEFFRDYPNFIGFNYSEQFWGFTSADFPVNEIQRYEHFANLLKLCNKYGGYLNINWCANRWSAPLNPVAMLKRCPEWKSACEKYSQNLQLGEKYTQGSFIEDVESEVFGAYVSGYCGNFGVRYDETGWTDLTEDNKPSSEKTQYRQITGLPIHLERMAFNGATIIDGPELIWADDFKETWGGVKDSEGYSCRNWEMHDQYVNATLDFFRKVIDGTIRIPTRQEVIDRTKVVVIQDNSTGNDHDKYSTYPTLFEGLYRMSFDGNLWDNTNLFKCTGRYPTIPTVYALRDDIAKSFQVQIKQSSIPSRWSSIEAKQEEFNKLFPSEYYGNCYAGRYENTWITYNPNKRGDNCGAVLSMKYNTIKEMDVNFNAYGNALIKEYSDHIDIYANNFDNKAQTTLVTDTFKFIGCSSEPTFTATDTGRNQTKSQISSSYSNGTYTLTVKHNGPVSISVKCSGTSTGKLTSYKTANLKEPAAPPFYTGVRQYEAELFDQKNIEGNVSNACGSGVTGVQGQGFMKYGKNANAAVKDTVRTQKAGEFKLNLRYSTTSDTSNVDLYVNGSKVKTLSLKNTSNYSNWQTVTETITLKQGDNKIEFKSNGALPASLYMDNFTVEGDFGDGEPVVPVEPDPINGRLIKNLKVKDTENAADWSIDYDFGKGSLLYGDRDITCAALPDEFSGAEYIKTACDSKLFTYDEATFEASEDMAAYVAVDTRVVDVNPAWLSGWTDSGYTMTSSNDVIFKIYEKSLKAGEAVTLGTNGGLGISANYVVMALKNAVKPPKPTYIKGDVNLDGSVTILDAVLLQKYISGIAVLTADQLAQADVCEDGRVNIMDLCELKAMLVKTEISPDVFMAQVSVNILNSEPSDAAAENAGTAYGTYEKKTIYSEVCKREKNFNVLLPAGYTTSKKYPVLYVLHGYWGDEDALLDKGDASLRLRQIIGNAIAAGEAEDMIVVFPDIYAIDTQDKCDGLDAKNNKAYDNFINLLTKEIMPYMEQNYSIKTGRDNTAITGFSMGGRESLNIGFTRPDLFGYVGAMCPAPGLTEDLIAPADLKYTDTVPYMTFISAGSNDTLIWSTPAGYHDNLNNNGVNHIWHYVDGGDHGGKTIRPHIYNFIRAVFKAA